MARSIQFFSSLLARGARRVLWTDDFTTALIAKRDHGISRVWTQVLVDWLANGGHISSDDAESISLDLLVAGYSFTALRSAAVREAARRAAWDPRASPLCDMIDYFALPNINDGTTFVFAGHVLKDVWLHAGLEESAKDVTIAILESMVMRPKGYQMIVQLRKSIDLFFGLDVVHAAKCRRVIDEWLERRTQI